MYKQRSRDPWTVVKALLGTFLEIGRSGNVRGSLGGNWKEQALSLPLFLFIALYSFHFEVPPIRAGLDPSWRFALNDFVNSGIVFGRDVFFTNGPLGFLRTPLNIGSNALIAGVFQVAVWGLFLMLLCFSRQRSYVSQTGLIALSVTVALTSRITLDYSITFLTMLLLLLGLYVRNWLPAFVLGMVLTSALFFIKFSGGLITLSAIFSISFVQILTHRKTGLLKLVMCIIFVPAFSCIGYYIYNPSISDLINFFRVSLDLSSEYSVAMSVPGPLHQNRLAFLAIAAYMYLCCHLFNTRQRSFIASIGFLPVIFLAYKHGFVRQDNHVQVFFSTILFTTALIILFTDFRVSKKKVVCIFSILAAFSFLVQQQLYKAEYLRRLDPKRKLSTIRNVLKLHQYEEEESLKKDRLPQELLDEIGQEKIGIFPSELSYAPTNHLNYSTFPLIQSYCAYTSRLDQINAELLNGTKAPPLILFDFTSIDDRHCLLDVPATWLSFFKWYEPVLLAEGHLLLKRRSVARFEKIEPVGQPAILSTGDFVPIPEFHEPVLARITLDLTTLGTVRKTIYKVLPVNMLLTDQSGLIHKYRVMPDTLRNALLMNFVPVDIVELRSLLQGSCDRKMVAFQLFGPGLRAYGEKMEVEFLKVPDVRIKTVDAPPPLSFPDNIPSTDEPPLFAIDSINNTKDFLERTVLIESGEPIISVKGWAVDKIAKREPGGIWLEIDGTTSNTSSRLHRNDVATHFGIPEYVESGFSYVASTGSLKPGNHVLRIKILSNDKKYYYLTKKFYFEIVK